MGPPEHAPPPKAPPPSAHGQSRNREPLGSARGIDSSEEKHLESSTLASATPCRLRRTCATPVEAERPWG